MPIAVEHRIADEVQHAFAHVSFARCGVERPGKVEVAFTPEGVVRSAHVTYGAYARATARCVERAFEPLTIAPFDGEGRTFSFELR